MTTNSPWLRRRAFVVMPFGKKEVPKKPRIDSPLEPEATSETLKVDFDAVYQNLFQPALEAAGLQPFRADDEEAAGDILKDMFAELVTADFVLADISILNANVFYELGIRHTVGPRGVICCMPAGPIARSTSLRNGPSNTMASFSVSAWSRMRRGRSGSLPRFCAWAKRSAKPSPSIAPPKAARYTATYRTFARPTPAALTPPNSNTTRRNAASGISA
jgi:hypothetical protein